MKNTRRNVVGIETGIVAVAEHLTRRMRMVKSQLEGKTKVVALDDGTFFIPIPDEFIQKLKLKAGDAVYINETEIWEDHREISGFTISKVEDEQK